MQKTAQPDWFCPLFSFWKNLVYYLLSEPGQVLVCYRKDFSWEWTERAKQHTCILAKEGVLGQSLSVTVIWGQWGLSLEHTVAHYTEDPPEVLSSFHTLAAIPVSGQGEDLLGLVLSKTQKEFHCLLWAKKKQRRREFMKGKPKKI